MSNHYGRLLAMIVLSFGAMYVLMYAMVNALVNAVPNLNQFYMAGLMTASMLVIELAVMGGAMYSNKKLNAILMAAGVLALILFWVFIREQTAVTEKQFLKSMIPHHAGAILMCKQATLTDAGVKELCQSIVESQEREISEMKAILAGLKD